MSAPVGAPRPPEEIARRSGSSFLVSFGALDAEHRKALTAVYAFCRVVDDAADDAPDRASGERALAFWEDELQRARRGEATTPLGRGLGEAIARFGVDPRHLHDVVEGVRWDLQARPMATAADLERYCFLVAGSVGLSCLPLFGASGERAERYAIELGHALQLTNVLRDLRADFEIGRVYVPNELLARLGVEPAWLGGGGPDEVYRDGGPVAGVVAWLAGGAHEHFAASRALLDGELRRKLVPAEIMGAVYRDLLVRLERLGPAVCRRPRVRVPRWRKLWLAWRTRRAARGS